MNYCGQQQSLPPCLAPHAPGSSHITWAGRRLPGCWPFRSVSPERASQENFHHPKTSKWQIICVVAVPNSRETTGTRNHVAFSERTTLPQPERWTIWFKVNFVTSPKVTSCVLRASELIHLTHPYPFPAATHYMATHPPAATTRGNGVRERFIFFLWESCLKCKLIDLHGFANITWRISQVSYISNHKLMPWCLDHLFDTQRHSKTSMT